MFLYNRVKVPDNGGIKGKQHYRLSFFLMLLVGYLRSASVKFNVRQWGRAKLQSCLCFIKGKNFFYTRGPYLLASQTRDVVSLGWCFQICCAQNGAGHRATDPHAFVE